MADFHSAKHEAQLMGYPNIIKPINMAGNRGVLRNNVDELKKNFSEIDGIIPPFGVKKANLF